MWIVVVVVEVIVMGRRVVVEILVHEVVTVTIVRREIVRVMKRNSRMIKEGTSMLFVCKWQTCLVPRKVFGVWMLNSSCLSLIDDPFWTG